MKTEEKRNTTFISLEEAHKKLQEEFERVTVENEALKSRIEVLNKMVWGSRSEKLIQSDEDVNQLSLFWKLLGEDSPSANAASEIPIPNDASPNDPSPKVVTSEESNKKKPQARPGRKPPPDHLKERVLVIPVPEDKRVDAQGNKLSLIGYETSTKVEYVKGHFQKVVIKREIFGYKDSREYVCVAPPISQIIPKGKFMDSFILYVVFQKYVMSIPLYRQMQDYNSLGLYIAKSVLSNIIRRFHGFCRAIIEAIRMEILSGSYISGDESQVRCQGLKKGPMKKGTFWVLRNEKGCYFQYAPTKSKKELEVFFGLDGDGPSSKKKELDWEGVFQSDGATVYDSFFAGTKVIQAGCWSHARRYFFDAKNKTSRAFWFLKKIAELFEIENDIDLEKKEFNWSDEQFYRQRKLVRQEKSKPIVIEIEEEVTRLKTLGTFTPHHPLTKALTYIFNQFLKLKVFLENGQIPIHNNLTEQQIKYMVIGRKNFLFVGSEDGGIWGAGCYTLTGSCRVRNIDTRAYFDRITKGLHRGEAPETLTPYALRNELPSFLLNK